MTAKHEMESGAAVARETTASGIDNDLYNRLADTWWDETKVLSVLRTLLNPARFGYFRRILSDVLNMDPQGKTALDVGCGGGLLAEEFARLGCRVAGIDPSEPSLGTARAHAQQSGLSINYLKAMGENLPFPDESFDFVYCCDVLEHVGNPDRVIAETARVLRPGGVYFYDTLNRTLRSKLVVITLLQEWRATRIMPPNLHNWKMFIKPREVIALLNRHGIENREVRGMRPEANAVALVRVLWQLKRGEIGFRDVAEIGGRYIEAKDISVSYMGYGIRQVRHPIDC